MASGVDTHTYFGRIKVISRNQACAGLPARAWFKNRSQVFHFAIDNTFKPNSFNSGSSKPGLHLGYGTVQMQRPTCEFESETMLVNLRASTRTRAREHLKALERALTTTLECLHWSTCLRATVRHCILPLP